MSLSMLPILLHTDDIPEAAREQLRAASAAPSAQRDALLRSAARLMAHALPLDCADIGELVGLKTGPCGC